MNFWIDVIRKYGSGLGALQLIGVVLAASATHNLGVQIGIGNLGFLIKNPVNASFVLADLAFYFGLAYFMSLIAQMGVVGVYEFYDAVVAKFRHRERKVFVDPRPMHLFSYDEWSLRIFAFIALYTPELMFGTVILYFLSKLFRKFVKHPILPAVQIPKEDEEATRRHRTSRCGTVRNG